jgi:F-type H+-transporting ATPase subunit delta
VFHGDRWAAAFTGALGKNAEAGLACLRTMVPPVRAIPGALFGRSAARQLEKILRESAAAAGGESGGMAAEYAIRFISLLVEKNCFKHIDSVLQRIEKRLDEQKGILDVTAESAAPLDGDLAAELRRLITRQTGAAGIKMETRLVPELLGGYRLRIGGFYVDASLKRQLEQLTADLARPVDASGAGAV